MIQIPQERGGWMHPAYYELADYVGPNFNLSWCAADEEKAVADRAQFKGTDEEWTKRTLIFAYQNIALSTAGIHRPYIAKILSATPDMYGVKILDYGAGGGQFGLAMHFLGYRVSFADIYGASMQWLSYRLRALKIDLPVYIIDDPGTEIPHQNFAVCFDVIEHLGPEAQKQTLERLGKLADVCFVNLIRETGAEHPGVHAAVDMDDLTSFVSSRWGCVSEDFYPDDKGEPRQRLLVYGNVTS